MATSSGRRSSGTTEPKNATSVAAINQAETDSPEPYSSRGPVTHYFEPVNGVDAAEPLKPEVILSKPDLTATDCNVTTFFAEFVGTWRFCGTSAAAPHAAAVAALMLQKEPFATPQRIRAAMRESATSIGTTFGPCAIGAGLVEAVGAMALLFPGPGSPAACAPPESGPIVNEGEPEPRRRRQGSYAHHPAARSDPTASASASSPRSGAPDPPRQAATKGDPDDARQRHGGLRLPLGRVRRDLPLPGRPGPVADLPGALRTPLPRRQARRPRVARDAAGNSDPTAVVYSFRVKRVE